MADKKDYYDNGFIYTNYEEVKKPKGFSFDERYPVSGPHNFTDGQDVTGLYELVCDLGKDCYTKGTHTCSYIEAIPTTPVKQDMEAEARSLVEQFYKTSSGYQQERLFSATLSAITHCELMINEYCKYSELRNPKHQDERINHYTQLIEQIKNL